MKGLQLKGALIETLGRDSDEYSLVEAILIGCGAKGASINDTSR